MITVVNVIPGGFSATLRCMIDFGIPHQEVAYWMNNQGGSVFRVILTEEQKIVMMLKIGHLIESVGVEISNRDQVDGTAQ